MWSEIDVVTLFDFFFILLAILTILTLRGRRYPWIRSRHRRAKDITLRNGITRGPFHTLLEQLLKQLPHFQQLILDGSKLPLDRSKLSLDGHQPFLRRNLRLLNLQDDPHERVLLGMNFVERETLILAIGTDKFLLYA